MRLEHSAQCRATITNIHILLVGVRRPSSTLLWSLGTGWLVIGKTFLPAGRRTTVARVVQCNRLTANSQSDNNGNKIGDGLPPISRVDQSPFWHANSLDVTIFLVPQLRKGWLNDRLDVFYNHMCPTITEIVFIFSYLYNVYK